jgi:hypothetical protein
MRILGRYWELCSRMKSVTGADTVLATTSGAAGVDTLSETSKTISASKSKMSSAQMQFHIVLGIDCEVAP